MHRSLELRCKWGLRDPKAWLRCCPVLSFSRGCEDPKAMLRCCLEPSCTRGLWDPKAPLPCCRALSCIWSHGEKALLKAMLHCRQGWCSRWRRMQSKALLRCRGCRDPNAMFHRVELSFRRRRGDAKVLLLRRVIVNNLLARLNKFLIS